MKHVCSVWTFRKQLTDILPGGLLQVTHEAPAMLPTDWSLLRGIGTRSPRPRRRARNAGPNAKVDADKIGKTLTYVAPFIDIRAGEPKPPARHRFSLHS